MILLSKSLIIAQKYYFHSFKLTNLKFNFKRNSKYFYSNAIHISLKKPLKKDVSGPYPLAYEPKKVEEGWYEWWEENGLFLSNSVPNMIDKKVDFSLVLPPPNVTGSLHIGHTFTATIQDCISRWHRMNGFKVSWIPGFDHGGIATQSVVEKKLIKERNLCRKTFGKTKFLQEISDWKTLTQTNIESQLRKIGSSLDFSKTSFTMDANASDAVTKVFIQLFEENLIYRKEKLVNWSGAITSVISDIEVDHLEIPGKTKTRVPGLKDPVELGLMDYFYYPILNSNEKLLVATTRLETMLGDSAVAVHPNDSRFSHRIGQFVLHPFTGESLPIISDESINKEFGSGVMKVTPAHDAKDFELGQKHQLKFTDIFTDDGTVTSDYENFKGKHRLIVRQLLRESLSAKGLFKESQSHSMSIPFCSRTGDIVEQRLKEQWYLDCSQMGEKAVQAVKKGNLKFIPEYHEKVWFEWFKHLKDWCISRQLWWGHQVPAYRIYHKDDSSHQLQWIAATSKEEAIEKASRIYGISLTNIVAEQDQDVLDTWFSSALYPLTSLGWPTKEIKSHYPLSLMETGFDILFFWVARMVMLSEHITGELPFNQVLLHGMVCDSHGRKMTKSLGNTIDPLDVLNGVSLETLLQRVKDAQDTLTPEEVKNTTAAYKHNFPNGIPECGADGLRFSLLQHDIQNQRINIDVKSIRVCRHFCNKIWQGFRLFTRCIESCPKEGLTPLPTQEVLQLDRNSPDLWILSRLASLVANSNSYFKNYEFHMTATAMRHFWVQNFCDVYLEYAKHAVQENRDRCLFVSRIMLTCIETFLRIISPVMPFLSEELYQRLALLTSIEAYASVTIAQYPVPDTYSGWRNTVLEADMQTITDLIGIARSLKSKNGVTQMRPAVVIAVEKESTLKALNPFSNLMCLLSKLSSVTFYLTQGQEFFEQYPQDSFVFEAFDHGITLILDVGKSQVPGTKMEQIRSELSKLNKMLSDSKYRKTAPLSVQEKTMAKKALLEGELQNLLHYYGKNDFKGKKQDSSSS